MEKMYLADYHLHSKYSFDGREELTTICDRAIAQRLSEIAITDHMDICEHLPYGQIISFENPEPEVWHMDVDGLYAELEKIKAMYEGRLTVRIGSELGQPQVNPEAANAFVQKYPLDFIIGSVHNMENDKDVYYYDFTQIDVAKMYDHYVDWLIALAQFGNFDVMGHLTYPLRYMFERNKMSLDLAPFEEKFRYLFKLLKENGRGIEVNVSGMYRTMKETMPPVTLLKLYKECGGEIITIGSDAHQAQYIGYWQREAHELLKSLGYKYFTTFSERKPFFHIL